MKYFCQFPTYKRTMHVLTTGIIQQLSQYVCLLHWTLPTTQDMNKLSQLHNHYVDSNTLVVARNGSVLSVQQAAEEDSFIQARFSNRVLHHNNSITITTASISINNFGAVYCSFKIAPSNYSASFLRK